MLLLPVRLADAPLAAPLAAPLLLQHPRHHRPPPPPPPPLLRAPPHLPLIPPQPVSPHVSQQILLLWELLFTKVTTQLYALNIHRASLSIGPQLELPSF